MGDGRKQEQGGCTIPVRRVAVCSSGGGKIDDGATYRHLQGMLIETLGDEDSPCYTAIYGMFQALEVKRNGSVLAVTGGGITNLAKFHDMDIKERTENQNEWKKHIEYGSRWQVEIFFSAFKRIFGSSVRAKTMDNIIQEIALKIQRYNQFVDITQRVISMA